MLALITVALLLPLGGALLSLFQSKPSMLKKINFCVSLCTSLTLSAIVAYVLRNGLFHSGLIYIDELSSLLLMVVALLTFTATLFSLSYMERELEENHCTLTMLSRYYGLLNVFTFTMISVLIVENLGLMWVAVEATTLASALLVAFYFNRTALEAAWKYVMVCTVGICLALLGTVLLYFAQVSASGKEVEALSWVALNAVAGDLDPAITKLAFIFVLIGYGTKAGLAPMHTWLPDAHSQAPSPVSGLLSGALLSCALYAFLRNMTVLKPALSFDLMQTVLIGFGLLSIIVAIPFILIQQDVKRLLAYSSVEHMGIITLGIGIGTPLAVYGALLHILNHAMAKSALFYVAGIITQEYRTKHIMRIRGLISTMPLVGTALVIGVLTITGTPPFNIFVSKITVIWAAFDAGKAWLGGSALILLAAIFAGMMYYCMRMAFGKPVKTEATQVGKPALAALSLSVGLMLVTGLYLPNWLNGLINRAAAVVIGG